MARPAKSVGTIRKNMTREEIEQRKETENRTRGKNEKLIPPLYLSDSQKFIFDYIMAEMQEANILGNLDLFILSQTAIAIDRLQTFEKKANENAALIIDNSFRLSRDMYSKEFMRCCNELCLSPQSRAKLSIANINPQKKKNPLMEMMEDEDDYN